jgi:hypothetical protein
VPSIFDSQINVRVPYLFIYFFLLFLVTALNLTQETGWSGPALLSPGISPAITPLSQTSRPHRKSDKQMPQYHRKKRRLLNIDNTEVKRYISTAGYASESD